MGKQAAAFGRTALTRAAEIISAGLVEMRGATSPRLLLELMCAQVLLPAPSADAAELAQRIERLERSLTAGRTAAPQPQTKQPQAGQPRTEQPRTEQPRTEQPRTEQPRTERPSPAQRRPEFVAPASPRSAQAPPTPAPASRQLDTHTLRTRWPDVLAAVQGRKRVAWMQLSNASVDSITDGVLTLTFAKTGTAKGFLTGGYDQVLSEVLAEMFGATPTITTSVGTPSDSPPRPAGHVTTSQPVDHDPGRNAASGRPAEPGRRDHASRPPQQGSTPAAARRSAPAATTDNEPAPGDLPAPDALTGTHLIERELGGRVIEELGGR
jgi:DNA polymerase-3 subunit gamma/tau